jgi:signal transduction histidine kinase
VVLLFPYSLMRWASGKESIAGLLLVWATYLTAIHEAVDLSEVIGGAVVLAIPAILGAEVRSWSGRRRRERGQIRLKERELLARDLHDTVAHHVSAIAIQAQAGKELAKTDPEAALATLSVIEGEASRTLHEMRTMVGALRDGEEPELAPPRGVADLHRLADTAGDAPPVSVELIGEFNDVQPAVDSALYRLAQESITNAIRHARAASRVEVKVVEQPRSVMLTVVDDGEPSLMPAEAGYGIIGMEERTKLLGGSFKAGPAPGKGWRVVAVLPKNGTTD